MTGDRASSLAGGSLSNLGGKCDSLKRCWVFSCSGIPMWSLWRMPVVGVLCNKTAQCFLVWDELAWVRGKLMKFANSWNLELLFSLAFWGKCPVRLAFTCRVRDLSFLEGWLNKQIFSLRDVWWVFLLQILTFNIVHLKLVSTAWKTLQHKCKPFKKSKPLKINRLYSPQKHQLSETPAFNYC